MVKTVPAWVYQQYDADYSLEHPGRGYGGWQKAEIPVDPAHTAILLMHAWEGGTPETNPALHRVCEYLPRGKQIIEEKFPDFLEKVRASGFRLIHIGSQSEKSVETLPGYIRTKEMYPPEPGPECIKLDKTAQELHRIHTDRVLYGHNLEEIIKVCSPDVRDFAIYAADDEDVACTSDQLFELCKKYEITHLIYTGFCVNACLTMSPCGFIDMMRHGLVCSVVRDLTTAVENKESCAEERHKEYGLWAFSLWGGFVFDQADIEQYLL